MLPSLPSRRPSSPLSPTLSMPPTPDVPLLLSAPVTASAWPGFGQCYVTGDGYFSLIIALLFTVIDISI